MKIIYPIKRKDKREEILGKLKIEKKYAEKKIIQQYLHDSKICLRA